MESLLAVPGPLTEVMIPGAPFGSGISILMRPVLVVT